MKEKCQYWVKASPLFKALNPGKTHICEKLSIDRKSELLSCGDGNPEKCYYGVGVEPESANSQENVENKG